MPTEPLYCISSTTFVIDTCSAITPSYTYTAATIPEISEKVYFSDFGTLLYDEFYNFSGNGDSVYLTTIDLWLNLSGDSGPMIRSGIWTSDVTSASTFFSPFNKWIGFSVCFDLTSTKTYYIGLGGDNAVSLRLNGQTIIQQDYLSSPVENFRYWHIYPVRFFSGNNVLEVLGMNYTTVAGFGVEVYDNTLDELTGATQLSDLNIIFSTIEKTGQTFDLVYDLNYTPTVTGYTCESGSTYTYQSCSGRCATFSSTTTNSCSSTLIKNLVSDLWTTKGSNINGISYGYKQKGGKITRDLSIIYQVLLKMNPVDLLPEDIVPDTVTFSGYTFQTDVVAKVSETSQNYLPYEYTSCPDGFDDWRIIDPPNKADMYRPLKGGISVRNMDNSDAGGGTLGGLVVDNDTNTLVGITNLHCITRQGFFTSERNSSIGTTESYYNVAGNLAIQPGYLIPSTDYIGIIKKYTPFSEFRTDNLDSALITINESDIDYSSSFQMAGLTGWTSPMDFATTEELDDLLNTNPYFYYAGATTGPKGESECKFLIYDTNRTIYLAFAKTDSTGIVYRSIAFSNLITLIASADTIPSGYVCKDPSWFGNSGSLVCAEIDGVRKIVGQFFAVDIITQDNVITTCILMRIDDIANRLNISAWIGQPVNFSDTGSTETVCLEGTSSEDFIIIDGKKYWQMGFCTNP